eukprot:scaffold186388_cov29-Tisochrysis_lutea.AAC.7
MLRVLEADLRSLSLEARRRFPEVKEAAEAALGRLRSSSDRGELPLPFTLADDLLLPFTLALAARSDTLPPLALAAVQRLLAHGAVHAEHLPAIASQLVARAGPPSSDEMLLKVLQTVLTVGSCPQLLTSEVVVGQLLSLCLALLSAKSPTVRRTASATGQQFVALLLELAMGEAAAAAAAEPTAESSTKLARLPVASRCAYLAMLDLCLLAAGEPPQWLSPLGAPVPVLFALEVVQRALATSEQLFLGHAHFRHLLRERVCPLALKCMQHAAQHTAVGEWEMVLRTCHLATTLLGGYAKVRAPPSSRSPTRRPINHRRFARAGSAH